MKHSFNLFLFCIKYVLFWSSCFLCGIELFSFFKTFYVKLFYNFLCFCERHFYKANNFFYYNSNNLWKQSFTVICFHLRWKFINRNHEQSKVIVLSFYVCIFIKHKIITMNNLSNLHAQMLVRSVLIRKLESIEGPNHLFHKAVNLLKFGLQLYHGTILNINKTTDSDLNKRYHSRGSFWCSWLKTFWFSTVVIFIINYFGPFLICDFHFVRRDFVSYYMVIFKLNVSFFFFTLLSICSTNVKPNIIFLFKLQSNKSLFILFKNTKLTFFFFNYKYIYIFTFYLLLNSCSNSSTHICSVY